MLYILLHGSEYFHTTNDVWGLNDCDDSASGQTSLLRLEYFYLFFFNFVIVSSGKKTIIIAVCVTT